jgi:hypothetical protein
MSALPKKQTLIPTIASSLTDRSGSESACDIISRNPCFLSMFSFSDESREPEKAQKLLEEAKCQKKLRNIIIKRRNIILMPLGITMKRPSIMKPDITRRQRITHTLRGRTRFIVGITLTKQQRCMAKSTARSNWDSSRAKHRPDFHSD